VGGQNIRKRGGRKYVKKRIHQGADTSKDHVQWWLGVGQRGVDCKRICPADKEKTLETKAKGENGGRGRRGERKRSNGERRRDEC